MPLYQVQAGDRILAADINQFYQILKGVAASGETVTLIYNNQALILQPSSDPSAGTRVVLIKNTAGTVLATWRYDGLIELLSAAAAPATPVAGSLYHDTVINSLRFYDGTSWQNAGGAGSATSPNLVLNSDFSRRTVFGLAMPEVFADTSGYTVISGAAPTVGSNIVTSTAANEIAWQAGSFIWRDGRASGSFKAVAIAGIYQIKFRVDANIWLSAKQNNGNFTITSGAGAADTVRATVANVLTINRWYWIEIEVQGTTIVGKIYDTGGTVPGVTKASSTLLQTLAFTGVTALTGAAVSVNSDQALAQWGGIATVNGGVYVETWLPESFTVTFQGTLGGQALGIDESANAGPGLGTSANGKQWALRSYIPAVSRQIAVDQYTLDGGAPAGSSVEFSGYLKTSGKGGAGNLVTLTYKGATGGSETGTATVIHSDAAETSWTRKTGTVASDGGARQSHVTVTFGSSITGATGTGWADCVQLEQGSAATAWRSAPSDDAPVVWELALPATNITTTSGALVELDSRDAALNPFFPWDANIVVEFMGAWGNSNVGNQMFLDLQVATVSLATKTGFVAREGMAAATQQVLYGSARGSVSAGHSRIRAVWQVGANTGTMYAGSQDCRLRITAYRGK